MSKECLKSLVKNVDAQLFEIVNNLICSICQELFNKPVTTPCGHSFCSGCIKRVLSSKNNSGCPLCKNPVKRYGLEADEVKSKFTEICKELPHAFEQDVSELTKDMFDLGEDLIKSSKLSQFYNQECVKESKTNKPKLTGTKKGKKAINSVQSENDSESFCPVLKRVKNVQEYASAKKKRMDDLVSVSQTEPVSSSSLGESYDLNKKLAKIEKIPPEEKIKEWFNAVGDNIFINSPGFSILEINTKNESDSEKKEESEPSMIRRDYNKPGVGSKTTSWAAKPVKDPYEFFPSQNTKPLKKKRQKSTGKKIQDFKALQSFSKESIKRNEILMDMSREELNHEEEIKNPTMRNQITASQKFDQLLKETKEESKKVHALYLTSQSSSAQFLDISPKSKAKSPEMKETSQTLIKTVVDEEEILFKSVDLVTEKKQGRSSLRPKRRKSSDVGKGSKKQKLLVDKQDETLELARHNWEYPRTKLEDLLQELVDDDIIYATRPTNAPVRLPEATVKPQYQQAGVTVTQNTELIGFCTQEECPVEKNFKQLVENMEKELDSSQYLIENQKPEGYHSPGKKLQALDSLMNADENGNCKPKISKTSRVEFLHLGKLTPVRKRAKSTVVKVVFPIGLTSLARRRVLETSYASPGQITRRRTCQVSTGIQTTHQQPVSCLVQTTQVPRFSATMQTSQEERSSVEIQTSQKCNASAEVQTSQNFVCQEIQTTQVGYESANVQTTLSQTMTPQRKPSHLHRKIVKRKKSRDADSSFPTSAPEEDTPEEKEVLMDFDVEEEFEKTWQKTQKHDHFVELKNKKNKERSENLAKSQRKSIDIDSDEDSDVQPPKRRISRRILSQESVGVLEEFDTRQIIPLDVQKVTHEDDEMEIIQLDTPKSQNSEEQMLRVLKNIDLDLPKGRSAAKGEKSEESDSDFFVEQTPPRTSSRSAEEMKTLSRSRSGLGCQPRQLTCEYEKNDNLDDVIGDSITKGFSESFLLLTAPQKTQLTSEKNPKEEIQKMNVKIQPTIDLPNENDQNQMNAFDDRGKPREEEAKTTQLKAVLDTWKMSDAPLPVRTTLHKKLCVVASSVKNPDLIKKFASRFKIEYLSKPTKDMTHLIVGLHENEEREVLPLCTPKLLFAMANRKWVVSELWPESCLKANMILPEESFETLDPVGGCGCQNARISGEKLLRNCEIYLLGEFQMISKEEFADLIVDCGGSLVPTPERFSFLPSKLRMIIADRDCLKLSDKQLQELYQKHSTVVLSRDVIIMSIQSYKLANFSPYLLHPATEERLVKLGYPSSLVRNEEEEEEDTPGSAR